MQNEGHTPPPTVAFVFKIPRRSMSVLFSDVFSLMVSSSSTTQRRRAMDGLADAMVCSAAAGVGHLSIDIRVRRFRFLFQQRHRSKDLPRLAIAALRNIKLLPRELHRV